MPRLKCDVFLNFFSIEPSKMDIMAKDLIKQKLGGKARIVIECPYIKTTICEPGAHSLPCTHPDATYGYVEEYKSAACVVAERVIYHDAKKPFFLGEFECPLEKSDGIARGYQSRKVIL